MCINLDTIALLLGAELGKEELGVQTICATGVQARAKLAVVRGSLQFCCLG